MHRRSQAVDCDPKVLTGVGDTMRAALLRPPWRLPVHCREWGGLPSPKCPSPGPDQPKFSCKFRHAVCAAPISTPAGSTPTTVPHSAVRSRFRLS